MLWWHDPLQAPDKLGGVATLYYKDDLNLFEDQERQMWDRDGRIRTMPATKDTFRVAIKRWLAAARRLSELKPYPYRVDQWEDGLPGVEAAVCDIERFENWFTDHKDQILREKTEWKTIHMLRTCQMNAFKLAKHLKAASQLNELLNETDQIANWLNRVAHGDFDTADNLAAECKSQIHNLRTAVPKSKPKQRSTLELPQASEHYDSVNWYGTPYTFTTPQAAVVKVLWEAWKAGKPSVLGVDLIDAADSHGSRLRDIFKSGGNVNPAWNKMITKEGKSHYKLSPPKNSESQ